MSPQQDEPLSRDHRWYSIWNAARFVDHEAISTPIPNQCPSYTNFLEYREYWLVYSAISVDGTAGAPHKNVFLLPRQIPESLNEVAFVRRRHKQRRQRPHFTLLFNIRGSTAETPIVLRACGRTDCKTGIKLQAVGYRADRNVIQNQRVGIW